MLRKKKSSLFLIFSLNLFILLQAFTALAGEPVVFGVSLGLTGKFAPACLNMQNGLRLWEKQVNKKGGILGRPLKVLINDDQSSPIEARKIYQSYVDNGDVDFFIGPFSSEITAAVMPVVEAANIPMIATAASADSLWEKGYKNLFGMLAVSQEYSREFLEMVAVKGHTRIAIVSDDGPFGLSVAKGAKRWAEDFGLTVVVNEVFKKGRHDLTDFARQVAEAKATALIVTGHYNEAVDMRRALHTVGNEIAFFSSIGAAFPKYIEELGPLAEKSFSTEVWSQMVKHQNEAFDIFVNSYVEMFKKMPETFAAIAFATGQIYEAASTNANSVDPDKVRQMLLQLDAFSVIGGYSVNKRGEQQSKQYLLVQWQDGKLEVVRPERLSTKKPIIKEVK